MINKILDVLRKEQIIILQYKYNGNNKIFISKKGGLYYINHQKEDLEKKETLNNGYTNFNGLVAYVANILDNLGNIKLEKIEDCKFVIK